MKSIKEIGVYLAQPSIFFYSVFWLIVLVVAGTLTQKTIGLYQSQEIFFSSFFIMVKGWFPIPGGYLTMSVIAVGLSAKLLFKTRWVWGQSGVIIVHIGALMLLIGGALTATFSTEGNMVIPEGGTTSIVSDYHKIELAVVETTNKEHNSVIAFSNDWLKTGTVLSHKDLPFQMVVDQFFKNTLVTKKTGAVGPEYHGFSKRFDLSSRYLNKEDERNRAGITFKISGLEEGANGVYSLLEFMPVEQSLQWKDRTFELILRHEQKKLPFAIELIDFIKEVHPGTAMARSFKSIVRLKDDGIDQRLTIQMNEPLRYKGYTFYQASFIDGSEEQTTVLAVVENIGSSFPYISSLIMCFGLLIHLGIQTPKLIRR